MSISELAEACRVGDTSVFRFCKTMKCKGYQEFKMCLSLSLTPGKTGLGQMEGNVRREDSFSQTADKVLRAISRRWKRRAPFSGRMFSNE